MAFLETISPPPMNKKAPAVRREEYMNPQGLDDDDVLQTQAEGYLQREIRPQKAKQSDKF